MTNNMKYLSIILLFLFSTFVLVAVVPEIGGIVAFALMIFPLIGFYVFCMYQAFK